MILLDANALLSLVLGQSAEREVDELLRTRECAIPAACLAEVVDMLVRKHGVEREKARQTLGPLLDEAVAVAPADRDVGWRAGEIRAEHYGRSDRALSMCDCLLLATAARSDEIATSDAAVVAAAHDLGLGVVPLPDSRGRRPEAG